MEMEYNKVLQIGAQVLLDPPFENGLFKPPSKHVEGHTGLNLAFSEYLVLFLET